MKDIVEEYFNSCIKNSWTYARLTKEEKQTLIDLLSTDHIQESIKGCYKVKWNILHTIYETYLKALGYNPFNWRENNE